MNAAIWSPWAVTHPWLTLAAGLIIAAIAAAAVIVERRRSR